MLVRNFHASKTARFSLQPDFMADSISSIDFPYLKQLGVTTCLIDLDGTVVERGSFEVSDAIRSTLRKSGMDIKIATNRPRSRSLRELKTDLSASGVIHPHGLFGKPTKRYIRTALKESGLLKEEVVMVGDRVFQDIFGANRSGIYSLAVIKVGRPKGIIDAVISRLEKAFYDRLKRSYRQAG